MPFFNAYLSIWVSLKEPHLLPFYLKEDNICEESILQIIKNYEIPPSNLHYQRSLFKSH